MKIKEHFVVSKIGQSELCEDVIFMSDDFVAVIDGATDKSGQRYLGQTGGRFAALAVQKAMFELPAKSNLEQAEKFISRRLDQAILEIVKEPEDRPTVVLGIYSDYQKEVWRIGDVGVRIDDIVYQSEKPIDSVTSQARSLMLAALKEKGMQESLLEENDPGREFIMPLLKLQHVFANHPSSNWGYAAVNGTPVPKRFQECWDVSQAKHIILASDGYPKIKSSLSESETVLADMLARDPFCIGENASTKGLGKQNSFDDRAWIKIML